MFLNKIRLIKNISKGLTFVLGMLILVSLSSAQEIKVINTETFVYVSITYQGEYSEVPQAINMLMYNTRRQNILPAGPTFGLFPFSPLEEQKDTPQWEVGFPVNPPINPQAPLQLKEWPATKVAVITCPGTPTEKRKAYTALFNWLEENNYQQDGPIIERYLSLPEETSISPGNIEIWLPIKRKD